MSEHTVTAPAEPVDEQPESKRWRCPHPGCRWGIVAATYADVSTPSTQELIDEHLAEHALDKAEPDPPADDLAGFRDVAHRLGVTPDEPPAPQPEPDPRVEYIAGLREIATWLEAHPEVKLPYLGTYVNGSDLPSLPIFLGIDARTQMARIARAMGNATKTVKTYSGGSDVIQVWRAFRGLAVYAQADRDEVCERIVVGSHEVTEEVPDPAALAALPKVSVTRVVEDVRWECRPLLADEPTAPVRGVVRYQDVTS